MIFWFSVQLKRQWLTAIFSITIYFYYHHTQQIIRFKWHVTPARFIELFSLGGSNDYYYDNCITIPRLSLTTNK